MHACMRECTYLRMNKLQQDFEGMCLRQLGSEKEQGTMRRSRA